MNCLQTTLCNFAFDVFSFCAVEMKSGDGALLNTAAERTKVGGLDCASNANIAEVGACCNILLTFEPFKVKVCRLAFAEQGLCFGAFTRPGRNAVLTSSGQKCAILNPKKVQ